MPEEISIQCVIGNGLEKSEELLRKMSREEYLRMIRIRNTEIPIDEVPTKHLFKTNP
jgi:hypothetical protein